MRGEYYLADKVLAIAPGQLRALIDADWSAPAAADYSQGQRSDSRRGTIAIHPIAGFIDNHPSIMTEYLGGTALDVWTQKFSALVNDPTVKAIVIPIESGGGSVAGVQEAADIIFAARSVKPIITVADADAASAAYWLFSQGSEAYITPSGQVGSIGVVVVHSDVSQAAEKAGFKYTVLTAGRYKWEGHPYAPLDATAAGAIQSNLDAYYGVFCAQVARGRGVTQREVQTGFGQGRMVLAKAAVSMNMATGVKTLAQVLQGLSVSLFERDRQRRAENAARVARLEKLNAENAAEKRKRDLANPNSTAARKKRLDEMCNRIDATVANIERLEAERDAREARARRSQLN